MTGEEYKAAIRALGYRTMIEYAEAHGISLSSVRQRCQGRKPIPPEVALHITRLVAIIETAKA